jgi:hypothetical protein
MPPPPDPPDDDPPSGTEGLFAQMQTLRADAGCRSLSVDESLNEAAQQYSAKPYGTKMGTLARQHGYDGPVDGFTLTSLMGATPTIDGDSERVVTDCGHEDVGIGRTGELVSQWAVVIGHD